MKIIAIAAVKFYQRYLRRLHNRVCIYTPSCSHYTILAIEKYGAFRGCYYGFMRIKRCNGALYQGCHDEP
jgi:putative membrane protein insertion efficiency factor